MFANIDVLKQINLDDLVSSFGWQNRPLLARFLRRTFVRPAQTFAQQVADFDSDVGTHGLVESARRTIRNYVHDIRIFGLDCVPSSAFLALSNHPGMSDTLALFLALSRPDLKIIALQRPFLEALPNVGKQLFYVKDDAASRMTLIRKVSNHLRNGGAALTFPAGGIEPDPDVHEGAVESLQSWTDSVGIFIRMAPETAILPVVVRGVIWEKAARHFLLKIRNTKDGKEQLAAALQLLAYVMWKIKPVTVRVQISQPICTEDLGTSDTHVIHQAVLAKMKCLIENPPRGEGISLL